MTTKRRSAYTFYLHSTSRTTIQQWGTALGGTTADGAHMAILYWLLADAPTYLPVPYVHSSMTPTYSLPSRKLTTNQEDALREAARLRGIPLKRTLLHAYAMCVKRNKFHYSNTPLAPDTLITLITPEGPSAPSHPSTGQVVRVLPRTSAPEPSQAPTSAPQRVVRVTPDVLIPPSVQPPPRGA